MTARRTFSKVASATLMAGLAGLVGSQAAHADADDALVLPQSLAGSDTAIILGGTTEPHPSTAFAHAAENVYLHALGFDNGAMNSTVCDIVAFGPCAAPLQVLTTPELIQQGPSSITAANDVVLAVQNEFSVYPDHFTAEDPLVIFGYSQSATAESIAMTKLEADPNIDMSALHFVFIGDPSLSGTGVWPNIVSDLDSIYGDTKTDNLLTALGFDGVLGNVTPDNISPTTIFTLDHDSVPDFQQDFEKGGLLSDVWHLFTTHVEYLGLTPEELATGMIVPSTDPNSLITNVDIPNTFNNAEAWLSAVFEHGAAGSGLVESLVQSIELYLTNSF
jgi:PE-PPE domain